MAKYNWTPVDDMDLDDGTHTCYVTESNGYYIYLTQIFTGEWDVELQRIGDQSHYTTLVSCRNLTSAKRWAAKYL